MTSVTREGLVGVHRGETELVAQRLQTEFIVECGTAEGDQLRTAEVGGRSMHVKQVPGQGTVMECAHLESDSVGKRDDRPTFHHRERMVQRLLEHVYAVGVAA